MRATYRLQLNAGFGFDQAAETAAYLARLGVSHLYSSPYLQAAPGSTHGYDVVDHSRVNAELGGEEGHARLCLALADHHLGQLLDIVPNHMAIAGRRNRWWWDVLENGRSSRYATYFDIAWDPPEPKLKNTILVPVLADHYGRELEAGRFLLAHEGVRLLVRYHDHEFPIDPRTYGLVLGDGFDGLGAEFAALPVPRPDDRAGALRRHLDKQVLLTRLERLDVDSELDARIAATNADPDRLDELLEPQNYRLARWQTAVFELDYRRFFDVNSLVALRMEDPAVFADTHSLVLEWLRGGVLDGVRIDHPDGLRDPLGYFSRLRAAVPRSWIVVEKILQDGEDLPERWPVAGSTGYDFAGRVLGLFVDPAGETALTNIYVSFTGESEDFRTTAYRAKHLVMGQLLASDLGRLTQLFVRVCEDIRRYRDYTRHELGQCLREVIACLPVYRTYVRPGEPVSDVDRARIESALAEARLRRPDIDSELVAFLGRILLLEETGEHTAELVTRFQQTSDPVTAKGVEDTAFYQYNRLVALNDVGGDPSRFGVSPEEFHAACARAAARWPAGLVATSTHDSKRSEDVRARLAVLSEIPEGWREAVDLWAAINEPRRHHGMLDRNTEYLLYQTLVGAWPISEERAVAYMEKAVREAKVHTSWIAPEPVYESAVRDFVSESLTDPEFLAALREFLPPVVAAGRVNSLAMKLLCLTAAGVADVYQGSELWDLSLVDPDNRRPVDFSLRCQLLNELDWADEQAAEVAWSRRDEGLPKLLVVNRTLRLRAEQPELFVRGSYDPLPVAGARAAHALAFSRGGGAVVVVPRLVVGMGGDWADTRVELPPGDWTDRFTGRRHPGGEVQLARLLHGFPVALLAPTGV
ncbi:MAG TPA: malto-oligosyltrehalose synthase [Candidatus Dormibacteraeota bacterium]|nr:malto-oligosyltrehalose synthase [Candidatus Dormibacteraeota bacterium]